MSCSLALSLLVTTSADAQEPPPPAEEPAAQTRDEMYDKPFVLSSRYASVGGYAEANVGYTGEEGIDEGPQFEFRRFNLFVFSQILPWIRFLSELEFEHGTEEIALETAQIDFELAPEIIVRAGIILPPIGAFNQDHDAPNWDFVDRPIVSTEIVGATLSEVGAGVLGDIELGSLYLSYQAYVTQGLGPGIVGTERTSIAAGKSEELIAADNNDSPAVTARIALGADAFEVGLSNHSGIYNTFKVEGERVDRPRWATIAAFDGQLEVENVTVRTEVAAAFVDVPASLEGPFAERQIGVHTDAIAEVLRWRALSTTFRLNLGVRHEYVDFAVDDLPSTGGRAGDTVERVTASVALRPGNQTVIRLNAYRQRTVDLVGNAPARGAGILLGVATYF